MRLRRAVSLVPSATDTLVALGAGSSLAGISADCDQPDSDHPLPVVTRPMIDRVAAAADPAATDLAVRRQLAAGGSLYGLDITTIVSLAPEVVFAQDQCTVCAVPSSEVIGALARYGLACEIVSLDPVSLDDVLSTFDRIGRAVGAGGEGRALESSCRAQLDAMAPATAGSRPRVLVLDWVDPPFSAGNWVPELVTASGGEAVLIGLDAAADLSSGPIPSHQVAVEAVVASRPDWVVVAPCGLDLEASEDAARTVEAWFASCPAAPGPRAPGSGRPRVVAFDGRIWFSRPGPRLVEGAEALSALLGGNSLPRSAAECGIAEITKGHAR